MKAVIRADASVSIGTGHVMRCLTLADALRAKGGKVSFVCRELSGDLNSYIEGKGYPVYGLHGDRDPGWETDAAGTESILSIAGGDIDWLIVDHYGVDARWEARLRAYSRKIMVIDDLANRHHDCDLLLDQNYHEHGESRYEGLLPPGCKKLLGPRYALLREEFRSARRGLRVRDGSVRRILIFFGGSDPTNETAKALEALRMIEQPGIAADVVVGQSNPNGGLLREKCASMPCINFFCQVDNMAELMARADLSIGAGGAATWERCYLGLPAITVITAENQLETTVALAKTGAIRNLGWHHDVGPVTIARAIEEALGDPASLVEMGNRAIRLMGGGDFDGMGQLLTAMGLETGFRGD
jgi:UDP-2,4-diacetamido-2,4,6-trideoxy-beta-L-altropyranose hydrolase